MTQPQRDQSVDRNDAMRWMEFLATAQIPCSRCDGLPAAVHVYATAKGAMCRRCLVEMPTRELKELASMGREWDR